MATRKRNSQSSDLLVRPEGTWFQAPVVWGLLGIAITTTIWLTTNFTAQKYQDERMSEAVKAIEGALHEEAANRDKAFQDAVKKQEASSAQIVNSLDNFRDEVRRWVTDTMTKATANNWILRARELNRSKYPDLVWPDLDPK